MKSIAKLKQLSGDKSLNEKTIKSITSERLNRSANNPDNIVNRELQVKNARLSKSLDSKAKKSNELDKEISTKQKALEVTGEEIWSKAKVKAAKIVKNAEVAMSEANSLLSQASLLISKIDDFNAGVEKREKDVAAAEKNLATARTLYNADVDNLKGVRKDAFDKLGSAEDMLRFMTKVFSVVIKRLEDTVKQDLDLNIKISQSLEKASIMYQEAVRKEKLLTADLEYLKSREAQLNNKEALLKDRENLFARRVKEIKRKK